VRELHGVWGVKVGGKRERKRMRRRRGVKGGRYVRVG